MSKSFSLFVGTYTSRADHVTEAVGQGIERFSFNGVTGEIIPLGDPIECVDPSYLQVTNSTLYALSEIPGKEGYLNIFDYVNSSWEQSQQFSTGAAHPCHVLAIKDQVFVANYMGNCLRSFSRKQSHISPSESLSYSGSGPNTDRQESPHLHQILYIPNLNLVGVIDLGSDRIWLHRIIEDSFSPEVVECIILPSGTGPRHAIYETKTQTLYVIGELSGEIFAIQRKDTGWKIISKLNLMTALPGITPSLAAIKSHPIKELLYVSDRSTSSIFTIAKNPNNLKLLHTLSLQGRTPRDIAIAPTGQWLLAANQDSNTIEVYKLSPSGEPDLKIAPLVSPCGTPVCLCFPS